MPACSHVYKDNVNIFCLRVLLKDTTCKQVVGMAPTKINGQLNLPPEQQPSVQCDKHNYGYVHANCMWFVL